jgi:thioredoxin reductase
VTDVIHDLLVVGGSPAGLSLAARASRAGLEETLVLALPDVVVPEHAVSSRRLAIRHVPGIDRISVGEEDLLVI